MVRFTPLLLYSRGKSTRYPLDRRQCRPQSRSGLCEDEKNRTASAHAVARHCTEIAFPAFMMYINYLYFYIGWSSPYRPAWILAALWSVNLPTLGTIPCSFRTVDVGCYFSWAYKGKSRVSAERCRVAKEHCLAVRLSFVMRCNSAYAWLESRRGPTQTKLWGNCELCLANQQLVARVFVRPEANYKADRVTPVTVWLHEDTQERKWLPFVNKRTFLCSLLDVY
jgi:hypothetical protein